MCFHHRGIPWHWQKQSFNTKLLGSRGINVFIEDSDAKACAKIHQQEIATGFFSQLGIRFLEALYTAMVTSQHALCIDAGIAVEPEDAAGLADALTGLMKDSAKCAMYGANGRKFIEKNFSRERMVDVLIHHIA